MNLSEVIPYWRYPPSLTRRTSVLRFIQVAKPIISSRIIRSQVEENDDRVALAAFMFILNISVEQTKFIFNGGSISRTNLTITLSVWHLWQWMLSHSPKLWLTRLLAFTEFEKLSQHRFIALRRYVWRFLSKIGCCNFVSEGILKILPLFMISTLSNNDVIHRVSGYFKCR